jgi:osmoprotectant transport system permease protein
VGEAWDQMWAYLASDRAWTGRNALPQLIWAHIQVSLVAVLVAAVLVVPPAVLLGHVKRGGFLAVSLVNVGRALPTFAVVVALLPLSLRWGFGLGFWPLLVALVLLAMPPIFTNTYTGVRNAPVDAVEAARGMGMRTAEVVRQVELPVAFPLILTGLRVSTVQVIATATLGAFVGYRSLGLPMVAGFQAADKGPLLAASLTVAALALVVDAGFAGAQRAFIPWRRPRR